MINVFYLIFAILMGLLSIFLVVVGILEDSFSFTAIGFLDGWICGQFIRRI